MYVSGFFKIPPVGAVLLSVASWSAISLPWIPTWLGIHTKLILVPADLLTRTCPYLRNGGKNLKKETAVLPDRNLVLGTSSLRRRTTGPRPTDYVVTCTQVPIRL